MKTRFILGTFHPFLLSLEKRKIFPPEWSQVSKFGTQFPFILQKSLTLIWPPTLQLPTPEDGLSPVAETKSIDLSSLRCDDTTKGNR